MFQFLGTFWRSLVLTLTPLLACAVFSLPAPSTVGPEALRCAYVLVVMAVFWVTEVLPVAVTALIPVAAFPALGIMGSVRLFFFFTKRKANGLYLFDR